MDLTIPASDSDSDDFDDANDSYSPMNKKDKVSANGSSVSMPARIQVKKPCDQLEESFSGFEDAAIQIVEDEADISVDYRPSPGYQQQLQPQPQPQPQQQQQQQQYFPPPILPPPINTPPIRKRQQKINQHAQNHNTPPEETPSTSPPISPPIQTFSPPRLATPGNPNTTFEDYDDNGSNPNDDSYLGASPITTVITKSKPIGKVKKAVSKGVAPLINPGEVVRNSAQNDEEVSRAFLEERARLDAKLVEQREKILAQEQENDKLKKSQNDELLELRKLKEELRLQKEQLDREKIEHELQKQVSFVSPPVFFLLEPLC